jgi:hypothetical protein
MNYKTREEAALVADNKNEQSNSTVFCPLINGQCRKDCVCWNKFFVVSMPPRDSKSYAVFGGKCGHSMLNLEGKG